MKKVFFSLLILLAFKANSQRMLVLPDTPRFANQNKGIWVLRIADNLPYYSNGYRWVLADAGSISPATIHDSLEAYKARIVTSFNGKRGDVKGVDSIWFNGTKDTLKWRYNNTIFTAAVVTDTVNKFVRWIDKNVSGDSTLFYIGATRYAIPDRGGVGGSGGGISTLGTGFGLVKLNDSTYRADTAVLKTIASALNDYNILNAAKVDKTTTITINGTTQDLSANRSWTVSGSGGTDNTNTGSFYRLVVPSSQAIKSLANDYGILIDSTSNAGSLTIKADSATLYNFVRALINDSLDVNALNVEYNFGVGDTLAGFSSPNTLRFKDFISGFGLSNAKTDTSFRLLIDTSLVSTKLYVDYKSDLKQDKLVSGTNIKTVNGNSLLGSGNISISGGTPIGNVGSGFRLMKLATQEVKTLWESWGIVIDSTSNTDGITIKIDSNLVATRAMAQKKVDSALAVIAALKTGIGNYRDSVANVADPRWGGGDGSALRLEGAKASGLHIYIPPAVIMDLHDTTVVLNDYQKLFGGGTIRSSHVGTTSYSGMHHMIKTGKYNTIQGITFEGAGKGTFITTDYYTPQNAIQILDSANLIIDCIFHAVKGAGILGMDYTGSFQNNDNNIISGCRFESNSVAIYNFLGGNYQIITNCTGINNYIGVAQQTANAKIVSSNFDYNHIGFIGEGGPADRGQITGSSFNHNDTALILKNTQYGYLITSTTFFWGGIYLKDADKTGFVNCTLATNGDITVDGSGVVNKTVTFTSCVESNTNNFVPAGMGKIIKVGALTDNMYRYKIEAATQITDSLFVNGPTGIGTTTPVSTFQVNGSVGYSYVTKTSTYTATASDYTIDCTSGTFTVNLPAASGCTGRVYVIKNSGTGTITIDGNSSETIDGATTQIINVQYAVLKIQSTGSGWVIIN